MGVSICSSYRLRAIQVSLCTLPFIKLPSFFREVLWKSFFKVLVYLRLIPKVQFNYHDLLFSKLNFSNIFLSSVSVTISVNWLWFTVFIYSPVSTLHCLHWFNYILPLFALLLMLKFKSVESIAYSLAHFSIYIHIHTHVHVYTCKLFSEHKTILFWFSMAGNMFRSVDYFDFISFIYPTETEILTAF